MAPTTEAPPRRPPVLLVRRSPRRTHTHKDTLTTYRDTHKDTFTTYRHTHPPHHRPLFLHRARHLAAKRHQAPERIRGRTPGFTRKEQKAKEPPVTKVEIRIKEKTQSGQRNSPLNLVTIHKFSYVKGVSRRNQRKVF